MEANSFTHVTFMNLLPMHLFKQKPDDGIFVFDTVFDKVTAFCVPRFHDNDPALSVVSKLQDAVSP
tara:strand:- start:232 stop:429 length:198 start_codon:yes stop_codon:yes gene_type:complete